MPLPRHPQLIESAMLFWCGNNLRIGVHTGLRIENAPPNFEQVIRALDGRHTIDQLHEQFPNLARDALVKLLLALSKAGLLQTNAPAKRIHVFGDPFMTKELIRGLVGNASLSIAPELYRRRVIQERVNVEPDGTRADLTIWAAETIEPDNQTARQLHSLARPYLVLRCSIIEAIVGPLVRPGTTPCLHCINLTMADQDNEWPYLQDVLSRSPALSSQLERSWVANTALPHILDYLSGAQSALAATTIHLAASQRRIATRTWSRHHRCPCVTG